MNPTQEERAARQRFKKNMVISIPRKKKKGTQGVTRRVQNLLPTRKTFKRPKKKRKDKIQIQP